MRQVCQWWEVADLCWIIIMGRHADHEKYDEELWADCAQRCNVTKDYEVFDFFSAWFATINRNNYDDCINFEFYSPRSTLPLPPSRPSVPSSLSTGPQPDSSAVSTTSHQLLSRVVILPRLCVQSAWFPTPPPLLRSSPASITSLILCAELVRRRAFSARPGLNPGVSFPLKQKFYQMGSHAPKSSIGTVALTPLHKDNTGRFSNPNLSSDFLTTIPFLYFFDCVLAYIDFELFAGPNCRHFYL